MALQDAFKVVGDAAGKFADGAKDASEKAIVAVGEGAQAIRDKVADEQYKARMRKYNPLFPKDYTADDYDRPKLVVIEDGDERKGIDVCEGAIGWTSVAEKLEVLHLYEEAIEFSQIHFFPTPVCGAAYYIDGFDSQRYINLDSFFEVAERDRLTELRQIAVKLGAKHCRLETYESKTTVVMAKAKGGRGAHGPVQKKPKLAAKTNRNLSASAQAGLEQERATLFDLELTGSDKPERPTLKWYAHDKEILSLIEMRFSENQLNKYTAKLSSSSSMTMSLALAAKLDAALGKMGAECNFTFEGEAKREMRHNLEYIIEF